MLVPIVLTLSLYIQAANAIPQNLNTLDNGIIEDLKSIAIQQIVTTLGNCTDIERSQVELHLFTNNQPDEPTMLDHENPKQIRGEQPLVFVIHGWISNAREDWMLRIKDEYLRKDGDYQVVLVNWSSLSYQRYTTSVCNLPKVAGILAETLCTLAADENVDIGQVHLVGHSLGAHIAGLTGKYTQSRCGRELGRITGLDPAGPGFQTVAGQRRLTNVDAAFVDVIHTNARVFGFNGNMGTVDFYPNCGQIQAGCVAFAMEMPSSLQDLVKTPIKPLICSHERSYEYFTESINSNRFVATSCAGCPIACIPDIFLKDMTVMGEETSRHQRRGAYVLRTNPKSPFA